MQAKFSVLAVVVIAFAWSMAAQTTATQSSATSAATASGSSIINAVLDKSIDAKKAKVGEQIEAKTIADAMVAGTTIPRGSKLIGHVTEVKPHEKGNAQSSLGLQFDQAVINGKQQVPIRAVVQAIAAPQGAPVPGGPEVAPDIGSPSAPGSGPRGPMSHGAAVEPNPSQTGQVGNIGNPAATPSGVATNAGAQLPPNATGVIGIRDLKLESESPQGSVITSDNRNVKLDGGTQLVLRVTGQ